jgi:hypothetical protein
METTGGCSWPGPSIYFDSAISGTVWVADVEFKGLKTTDDCLTGETVHHKLPSHGWDGARHREGQIFVVVLLHPSREGMDNNNKTTRAAALFHRWDTDSDPVPPVGHHSVPGLTNGTGSPIDLV